MFKSILKSAVLAAVMLVAAAGAHAYNYSNGANTVSVDPFAPNVAKVMRPTGTTDAFVKFADGQSVTLTGGWAYISGHAKVFHSYDGVQGSGNTVTAGLDAGYDAVAVVKNNIMFQTGVPATKCVTYALAGNNAVTLCQANYYDWLWSRTSPYGQGSF